MRSPATRWGRRRTSRAATARRSLPATPSSFFDRHDDTNPFRNDSFVFVPYCTGDVHAGSKPDANYGGRITHPVGYQNMTAYLTRPVPTVSSASPGILSGARAGGFGALAKWVQNRQGCGRVRVE